MADFIVKTGISKTVGMPNSGSFSAECGFEITLDIGVIGDPERLSRTIAQAYAQCLDSVNQQVALQVNSKPPVAPPVAPAPAPVEKPQPPAGTFGDWLKTRSSEMGLDGSRIVMLVAGSLRPDLTGKPWTEVGGILNGMWTADPSMARRKFDEALLSV